MYPDSFKNLISCLSELPGIGEKSAERLAFSIINYDDERLDNFANCISSIKNLKKCSICHNISDNDVCEICLNVDRNKESIVVVEKPKDVILFEKLGVFNGDYHVLDGLISPLEGVNPEDINLSSLIDRIKNNGIKEIILALKPSIEGETTMQYIKRILDKYDVRVTKIATGIPIGTDIEYIDNLTLELALEERKEVS